MVLWILWSLYDFCDIPVTRHEISGGDPCLGREVGVGTVTTSCPVTFSGDVCAEQWSSLTAGLLTIFRKALLGQFQILLEAGKTGCCKGSQSEEAVFLAESFFWALGNGAGCICIRILGFLILASPSLLMFISICVFGDGLLYVVLHWGVGSNSWIQEPVIKPVNLVMIVVGLGEILMNFGVRASLLWLNVGWLVGSFMG